MNPPKQYKCKNLIGVKSGRLTVIGWHSVTPYHAHKWLCKCACGNSKAIIGQNLTLEKTLSCGCLQKERTSKCSTTHGHSRPNKWKQEYRAWSCMMTRCYNTNSLSYKYYGAKGVSVCERWHKYENFYADMGDKPSDNHSLDRLDYNGDYRPDNCRWATVIQQSNNTSRNRYLSMPEGEMTLAQACRKYNVSASKVHRRVKKGYSYEDAVILLSLGNI